MLSIEYTLTLVGSQCRQRASAHSADLHKRESGMSTVECLLKRYGLRGKACLVTGGTKGIGRAVVEELAQLGAEASTCLRASTATGMQDHGDELSCQGSAGLHVCQEPGRPIGCPQRVDLQRMACPGDAPSHCVWLLNLFSLNHSHAHAAQGSVADLAVAEAPEQLLDQV